MFTAEPKGFIWDLRATTLTNGLYDFLEIQTPIIARVWLIAVLAKTPRYTGTSRGTYKPLARAISEVTRSVSLEPGSGKFYGRALNSRQNARKKKKTVIQGKTYKLGFTEGEAYGQKFTLGRVGFTRWQFSFTQELPYTVWNNIYPAPVWITLPSNPPWEAIEAGEKAVLKYIESLPSRKTFPRVIKNKNLMFKKIE